MRALVISDIHGNSVALETVLDHVKDEFDAVWCLGDVVGYGPKPNECVALLKDQPNLICLLGNHDAAATKGLDISNFNPDARKSMAWTKAALNDESISFLQGLPEIKKFDNVTLVHGSPRQPVVEYLLNAKIASENFEYFDTDFCFVGHTHLPLQFQLVPDQNTTLLLTPLPNETNHLFPRSIINPGSIGQPRDRDPRASFAIYDTEKFTWDYKRVDYDISVTQEQMKKLNLSAKHTLRLAGGL